MNPLRFLTDEDVYGVVADRLRTEGYDAVSTPEVNRNGESDESQLTWAAKENRTFVSFNVADLCRMHRQWIHDGNQHAGIVVSQQRGVGDTIRRLLHLAQSLDADDMQNRLEYLSNWMPD